MKKITLNYSDEQFIDGLNSKDHEVFTALYLHYFPQLLLITNKYIKDITVSEEIVQDVFLKIWEYPPMLLSSQRLRGYLCRSVVYSAINYLKHQKIIYKYHNHSDINLSDQYLEELYEAQELKVMLYREIELLPPQCKKIFKMSRFEGLKYREIAEQLGISEKTVEHHIIKALRILKTKIFVGDVTPRNYLLSLKMLLL